MSEDKTDYNGREYITIYKISVHSQLLFKNPWFKYFI